MPAYAMMASGGGFQSETRWSRGLSAHSPWASLGRDGQTHDGMRPQRSTLEVIGGIALAIIGLAILLAGGLIAAQVTATGGHPHDLEGFAVIIAGLFIGALGLRMCGID